MLPNERAPPLGIGDYDLVSVDEPPVEYMGVNRYLELHPDQVERVNEMAYRASVEVLLRDGRCEFCDRRPIAWGQQFDDELIDPRHHDWRWLTCDTCHSLYATGDDTRSRGRVVISSSQQTEAQAITRIETFRLADYGRDYRVM